MEPHPTEIGEQGAKGGRRDLAARFWEHHIRDEDDFRRHVEYCWVNPVKHGYVDEPEEWPYSYAVGRGLPRRGARFEPGMAG